MHDGMVVNKWLFDDFKPDGGDPDFRVLNDLRRRAGGLYLDTLDELVEQVAADQLRVQVGRVFKLDEIVEAHRCMEENRAGGKIVVLT